MSRIPIYLPPSLFRAAQELGFNMDSYEVVEKIAPDALTPTATTEGVRAVLMNLQRGNAASQGE